MNRAPRILNKEYKVESRVKYEKRAVWIDGVKTRVLAGTMHYFRVPREYWRDRMEKAREMGLNAIETYLCWNLHERREGEYDFSGNLDFEEYFRLAQSLGLYVVVRPGPYICSEWDNGALPSWLMTRPGIRFRRMSKPYIDALTRYLGVVIPKLKALQYDAGGPVISVQIENEYGSYCGDKTYLAYLRDLYRAGGITVPLFTADGVDRPFAADGRNQHFVNGGSVEGAHICLNFGSRGIDNFDYLKAIAPDDPPFCTEFWCGWFDSWGCGQHHTRSAESAAAELDDMLSQDGNVIFYAFHGGTDFRMTAGANGTDDTPYAPDTTSYDFDACLSESGERTAKFYACQEVIRKYTGREPVKAGDAAREKIPPPTGRFPVSGVRRLLGPDGCLGEVADKHVKDASPLTFEELGQDFGFVYYSTRVRGGLTGPMTGAFTLRQVRDRANVFADGGQIMCYYRNDKSRVTPSVTIPEGGMELSLLVENLGRINYGHLVGKDTKGIAEDVSLEWQILVDWDMWCLPLDNPDGRFAFRPFETLVRYNPAFYLVEFNVDKPADTWLKFPGVHGMTWVNGHPIGRYWNVGPTETLYVPGCWLGKGVNRLVIFETDKLDKPYVEFVDKPRL